MVWSAEIVTTIAGRDGLLLLFIWPVVSNSLRPHELYHARLPCPALPPGVCSNSCPLSRWCQPTISPSVHIHRLQLCDEIWKPGLGLLPWQFGQCPRSRISVLTLRSSSCESARWGRRWYPSYPGLHTVSVNIFTNMMKTEGHSSWFQKEVKQHSLITSPWYWSS